MIEKTLGWVWREDKQNKKQTIKKMRQNCLLCYHIPALIIHSRQIFIIQKGRWISIVISSWLDSFRLINEDDMTRCLLGRISDRKLNWWQETPKEVFVSGANLTWWTQVSSGTQTLWSVVKMMLRSLQKADGRKPSAIMGYTNMPITPNRRLRLGF